MLSVLDVILMIRKLVEQEEKSLRNRRCVCRYRNDK